MLLVSFSVSNCIKPGEFADNVQVIQRGQFALIIISQRGAFEDVDKNNKVISTIRGQIRLVQKFLLLTKTKLIILTYRFLKHLD